MNKATWLLLAVLFSCQFSVAQTNTTRVNIIENPSQDNVVTSTDDGKYHHLIGTYRGWDPNAVFIGGFNANVSNGYSTQKVVMGNHVSSNNFMLLNVLNGNVGIGVANPTSKLEVNGPFTVHYTSGSGPLASGSLVKLGSGGNDVAIQENWGINLCGTPTQPVKVYNSSLMVGYQTTGLNYGNNNLFVENNVGIGTVDTKGYKLAVNGDAIFTKIKVKEFSSWPDYVFQESYKLPSLQSVEAFIKKHQHLPEVPSAKDVEANGIDIAANQAALLRKIEEMTLYMIGMKKQLERQAKEIERQTIEIKVIKARKKQ